MGVWFHAAGLPENAAYAGGVMTYGFYRMALAQAIDPNAGLLWRLSCTSMEEEVADGTAWLHNVAFLEDSGIIEGFEEKGLVQIDGVFPYRSVGSSLPTPTCMVTGNPSTCSVHLKVCWDKVSDYLDTAYTEPQLLFLTSSDCAGKWSWRQCRDMYNDLSGYTVDVLGHEYRDPEVKFNMHKRMMGMLHHCWKRRVNLYWS